MRSAACSVTIIGFFFLSGLFRGSDSGSETEAAVDRDLNERELVRLSVGYIWEKVVKVLLLFCACIGIDTDDVLRCPVLIE